MNTEQPNQPSLEEALNGFILATEKRTGHRVADITADIYNNAYALNGAAGSYAASACKNASARAEMQRSGRELVRHALYLAYLLGWDLEEAGEHAAPSDSLLGMIQQFADRLTPHETDLSHLYNGRRYEGD